MKKKLTVLFIISFFLRLIALNQSFWLDEATTAKVISQFGFFNIISKFSPYDFHPPLYYLFMKFWGLFFGYSEISLRFPSIIFSLLTGLVVYKIGRLIKDKKTGFWAAVFFLFNPLIIYYSQEARGYMLTTFLLIVSLYFLIKILKNKNSRIKNNKKKLNNLILINLFFTLSFYTFYGAIFFIVPIFLYLIYQGSKSKQPQGLFMLRTLWFTTLFFIFSLFFISPLLYQQILHAKQSLAIVENWSLILGKANIKNLALIPIKFSIGKISFYPKSLYYLIAGLWASFVWGLIVWGGIKRIKKLNRKFEIDYLLFYLLFFPIILGLIFSFFTPLLQYFRFIYLIPIISLLLALEIKTYSKAKDFLSRVILIGFIIFSLFYLLLPQFHREDWKRLARELSNKQAIYMIPASSDALTYYQPKIKIKDLNLLNNRQLILNKIWVIPYTSHIYGINYKKTLRKNNFELKDKKVFRNLELEEWKRNFFPKEN